MDTKINWSSYFKGLGTGILITGSICWAIYTFFLTDDPRVERLNNELRQANDIISMQKDSLSIYRSYGVFYGSFSIPKNNSANLLGGLIEAVYENDLLQLLIDTTTNREGVFGLRPSFDMKIDENCVSPLDFDTFHYNILCKLKTKDSTIIELYKQN